MFRRYFIAGLLVWLPIWVTLLVISFLVGLVDSTLLLLPNALQPDNVFGVHIPGLGLIFSIFLVFFTGMFVANYFGARLVTLGESILARIPLVRSIYTAVKQVAGTMFSSTGESFRKVLLVEYPRKEMWSIAFQTGSGFNVPGNTELEDLITIFVPTTPNPTAGFLLMVRRQDVIELKMSVDQALKLVISLGVMVPPCMADVMIRKNKESI